MQVYVSDIIKDALNIIGVLSVEDTPSPAQYQAYLRVLNVMLDNWSARGLMLRSESSTSFSLVNGTYQYSIGTGQTINVPKPIRIIKAFARDSANVNLPVDVVPKQIYDSYDDQIISLGPPESLYYDPGASQQSSQIGTIFVYPKPDSAYTMFIDYDAYLTEFATVNDIVTFDPAYFEAITYNLAIRLHPRFYQNGQAPAASIVSIAKDAYRTIETMNARQIVAGIDLPTGRPGYNIYSDGFD